MDGHQRGRHYGLNGVGVPGSLRQSGGTLSLSGSGDISPSPGTRRASLSGHALFGSFAGLIALIVVGAMFITTEYRRGLIRVSMTASPRRGRLLAAKAVVIGAVSFVTGLIAAALAIAVGKHAFSRKGGLPLSPIPALTEVRMIVGTGALLAVAAVLALAIGTILRRSAAAVATVIAVIFIPFLLAIVPGLLPLGACATGCCGSPRPPLSPYSRRCPRIRRSSPPTRRMAGTTRSRRWAGFAVECAWAAVALMLAFYLLRRRDA